VLLSVQAGLKAGEIAKLEWRMILSRSGAIGESIELEIKSDRRLVIRTIPLHPDLQHALRELRQASGGQGPVIRSERGAAMTPASIVNWFGIAFRELGLDGYSSHSGRRTFLTRAADLVQTVGGTLRDVQALAGHRSVQTTQQYTGPVPPTVSLSSATRD
jgi:integrase/recombinase XerD